MVAALVESYPKYLFLWHSVALPVRLMSLNNLKTKRSQNLKWNWLNSGGNSECRFKWVGTTLHICVKYVYIYIDIPIYFYFLWKTFRVGDCGQCLMWLTLGRRTRSRVSYFYVFSHFNFKGAMNIIQNMNNKFTSLSLSVNFVIYLVTIK